MLPLSLSFPLVMATACAAAAINAVAGGGTFVTFPVLVSGAGLSEKTANIANTLGIWPGSLGSVAASTPELKSVPRAMVLAYSILSVVGGSLGAWLLVHTSDRSFARIIPWLLLFASVVFACGKRISRWAAGRHHGTPPRGWMVFVAFIQLVVAIYGGYFGAGIGILMLASLSFTGLPTLNQINALKVYVSMLINLAATVVFLPFLLGDRPSLYYGLVMIPPAVLGGFAGTALGKRLPQPILRGVILTVAVGLTAVYFYKAYGR